MSVLRLRLALLVSTKSAMRGQRFSVRLPRRTVPIWVRLPIGRDIYRNGDADAMARAEAIVQAHVAAHPELMAIPGKERAAAHS